MSCKHRRQFHFDVQTTSSAKEIPYYVRQTADHGFIEHVLTTQNPGIMNFSFENDSIFITQADKLLVYSRQGRLLSESPMTPTYNKTMAFSAEGYVYEKGVLTSERSGISYLWNQDSGQKFTFRTAEKGVYFYREKGSELYFWNESLQKQGTVLSDFAISSTLFIPEDKTVFASKADGQLVTYNYQKHIFWFDIGKTEYKIKTFPNPIIFLKHIKTSPEHSWIITLHCDLKATAWKYQHGIKSDIDLSLEALEEIAPDDFEFPKFSELCIQERKSYVQLIENKPNLVLIHYYSELSEGVSAVWDLEKRKPIEIFTGTTPKTTDYELAFPVFVESKLDEPYQLELNDGILTLHHFR